MTDPKRDVRTLGIAGTAGHNGGVNMRLFPRGPVSPNGGMVPTWITGRPYFPALGRTVSVRSLKLELPSVSVQIARTV
jgi:hypothetical protein